MIFIDDKQIDNIDEIQLFYCMKTSVNPNPEGIEVKFKYDDVLKAEKLA